MKSCNLVLVAFVALLITFAAIVVITMAGSVQHVCNAPVTDAITLLQAVR
jgi:hypothetical protein